MAKMEMHSEKGEMKKDINQDKKLIKKAFGMHDKQLHESKKTNLSKLAKGGMVGGKTNEGMKAIGRNLEKAKASGKAYGG